MEMMYNGTLVMPKNYAVVDEEEMTYVDGGWCVDTHWWGWNLYLTHNETKKIFGGAEVNAVIGAITMNVYGLIIAAFKKVISKFDHGHGIKIRLTAREIPTGIWTLSKKDENNIAKKNTFI